MNHPASPLVFVSSTVRDFGDLRGALGHTLRERGFAVNLSEANDFAVSGEREALDECFEAVRESDFYILLIGDEPGSVYPEDPEVTVTQQEFRTARDAFRSTGRPDLIPFVRQRTRDKVSAGLANELISAFVKEVKSSAVDGAPNWLYSFADFRDIMDTLAVRLRLGRDLTETLAKHSVLTEVIENLAKLSMRHKDSAIARHRFLERAATNLDLSVDDADGEVEVVADVATSLLHAALVRGLGEVLSVRAMQQALDVGAFLNFDATEGSLTATELDRAVRAVVGDCGQLRRMAGGDDRWDSRLFEARARAGNAADSVVFSGLDVTLALSFYNHAENVWNGHVVLAQHLLGKAESPLLAERRPMSPLGDEAVAGLEAESVEPLEVRHLLEGDIMPFGQRMSAERAVAYVNDARVDELGQRLRQTLESVEPDIELDSALIRKVAADAYENMTASPAEGIEVREHPKRENR